MEDGVICRQSSQKMVKCCCLNVDCALIIHLTYVCICETNLFHISHARNSVSHFSLILFVNIFMERLIPGNIKKLSTESVTEQAV